MKLFKRIGAAFQQVARQPFAAEHYEKHLEEWLCNDLSLIADDLLMLGKQVRTDAGKRIDLLALDKNGDAVIIELKRGESPRDLVGQINEYLSAVEQWRERDLEIRTNRPPRTLATEFKKFFQCEAPADFNRNPKAIVVVEDIDALTLKTFKRISVKVCKFSYLKSAEEEYLLVNEMGKHAPAGKTSKSKPKPELRPGSTMQSTFKVTLTPAFIKFGGFSVNRTLRNKFLPEQNKHFKITVVDYGEVDAWMSYHRIKIPADQFRGIMAKLALNVNSHLQMESLPDRRYELAKLA